MPENLELKIELYSHAAVQEIGTEPKTNKLRPKVRGAINNGCDGKICSRPYHSYLVIWKREFQEHHASAAQAV